MLFDLELEPQQNENHRQQNWHTNLTDCAQDFTLLYYPVFPDKQQELFRLPGRHFVSLARDVMLYYALRYPCAATSISLFAGYMG